MKEAEALEGIERQRAKDRQAENAIRVQPQNQNVEIFPPIENIGKTRDKVAQQTGIGRYQCSCKEKKSPLGKYFLNENQAETQSEIKKKELSDNKLTHSPANH